MSTEISTLLADVAPRPTGQPDVASIMRRGRHARTNRMLATIVAVPVIAGALWAGAQVGLRGPEVNPAAANPYCDWSTKYLVVFLDGDATRSEIVSLTLRARALDHVESVEWHDLFERETTFTTRLPRMMERLSRRSLPPWLDITLADPSYAGEVTAAVSEFALVDDVAGARLKAEGCQVERLERENERLERELEGEKEQLERQVREVLRQLEAAQRKARDR